MRTITLTQGKFALVDDEDFEFLNRWDWNAEKTKSGFYAKRMDENKKTVRMHRVIMKASKGELVDHRNGDGLNNQKYNLRKATRQQNGANRHLQSNSSSGVIGVGWHKRIGKWHAKIMVNYKRIHLGYFTEINDAISARLSAEKEYFGEYARSANGI